MGLLFNLLSLLLLALTQSLNSVTNTDNYSDDFATAYSLINVDGMVSNSNSTRLIMIVQLRLIIMMITIICNT